MKTNKRKRKIAFAAVFTATAIFAVAWLIVRKTESVECTVWNNVSDSSYTESEKVFASMSLSYLVYGCETLDGVDGTVSDILDTQKMGIISENADIRRTDVNDPSTALIDSASFIRQTVGNYRFLTDLKDKKSSFYGAAFADDKNKTVWISYAGSVSFTDAVQSAMLAVGAGLSQQEKSAFEFYETVLETEEIQSGYHLILTGHSLGGALASMVSRMSGCEAVTVSGADGLALSKINDIAGEKLPEYPISNYLTSPGNCGISLKNMIQRMMFWGDYEGVSCHIYENNGMVTDSHCVFGFVQFENGDLTKPILPAEMANE